MSDELLDLLRTIDWDHVLGLVDIPEAEYPLSQDERDGLDKLRGQIERLAALIDGRDDAQNA